MAIADISARIDTVTQDTCAGCPPSNGMLSAMNVESVSAISGMRNGKRPASAAAQQTLQASAVVGLEAHTGIHGATAVLVGQHLLGVRTLQQAPAHEGAQGAPSHPPILGRVETRIKTECKP